MKVSLLFRQNRKDILRIFRGKDSYYKLVYLGQRYDTLQFLQDNLPPNILVEIDEMLTQKAWELTQSYIDWIGAMGSPYRASLIWWTSNIAEKNTSTSNLFLNLCYIEIVDTLIKEGENNLFILVDDWALFLTFVTFLKEKKVEVNFIPSARQVFFVALVRESTLFLARLIKGIYKLFYHYFAARTTARFKQTLLLNKKPRVLIHTCIDEACLMKDGSFFDRYFCQLPQWLKKRGFDVVTVVWPYNFKRSLFSVFTWFRTRDEQFLIPEDYFCLKDYPKAIFCILRQLFVPVKPTKFEGIDGSMLLFKEQLRQASDLGKVRFLLYESMVKGLKKKRYRIDYFLDMFENMNSEKPVTKALHRYYPRAKIYGFQHSTIYPFMLIYSLNFGQYKDCSSVFPDKIICNGKTWVEVLSKRGFPVDIMGIGPALRYQYLFDTPNNNHKKNRDEKIVLVALPLEYDTSIYILQNMKEAMKDSVDIIALKPHPMIDKYLLMKMLSWDKLPKGMFWIDGELKEWLHRSTCVVGSATAVILESIFAGVPVVVVGERGRLEMNPLAWWGKDVPMFRSYYNPQDIKGKILYWISIAQEKRQVDIDQAKSILDDCFAPWDENLLNNIFPPLKNTLFKE